LGLFSFQQLLIPHTTTFYQQIEFSTASSFSIGNKWSTGNYEEQIFKTAGTYYQ